MSRTIRTTAVFARAERLLMDYLEQLVVRAEQGDDGARAELAAVVSALATLAPQLTSGRLLTTRELAERYGVHPRTILRKRKAGKITPALQLGNRGRAALRWQAP